MPNSPSAKDRVGQRTGKPALTTFSGKISRLLSPISTSRKLAVGRFIPFSIRPSKKIIQRCLDPNPARLQPMTVTEAVHVNKTMGVDYADN